MNPKVRVDVQKILLYIFYEIGLILGTDFFFFLVIPQVGI